jgi:hypothetical protein
MQLDFSALRTEALYQVWLRSLGAVGKAMRSRRVFAFIDWRFEDQDALLVQNLTPQELLSAFPAVCVLR